MFDVKLLTETAKCPTLGSDYAAGFDIYADESVVISQGLATAVSTGIAVKIPHGFMGNIEPRSGLAVNYGIDTMAGTIDSDYRGEIKVVLTSHMYCYTVAKGERIAQLVIRPVENSQGARVVAEFDDETNRGTDGFGSTGKS